MTAPDATGADPAVATLLDLLDLEKVDDDLYRGRQPDSHRARVYGGQVAAQALVAGVRSVDADFTVHSCHSYFLLPGDYAIPIVFEVERIRDGRSFATRRVMARQHGRPIFYMTLSFHRLEEGYDHQEPMPEVAGPDTGVDLLELMRDADSSDGQDLAREWGGIDIRFLGNTARGMDPDPLHPSQAQMWIRVREGLASLETDPLQHLATFTYASDVSILGASLAVHRGHPGNTQMASLDHTIWFHRPFRADRWWLYDQWSPSAHGGRGLSLGRVFSEDGALVATVAQEGLIRPRRDRD